MSSGKKDNDKIQRLVAEARLEQEKRQQSYRERALKLYPSVCAKCGREFSGKKLRELTVHHKDQNNNNNPPDGSNWELLCLYCHDDTHSRNQQAEYSKATPDSGQEPPSTYKPFTDLEALLKRKK